MASRILLVLLLAVTAMNAIADADTENSQLERRVKAAFLYKFAGYVEWPDGTYPKPDTPVVIAVAGDDQLVEELTHLAVGHTVDGRSLEIRKQTDNEPAAGVNILFIAHGEMGRLRKSAKPILIVTEAEGALNQGSSINFFVENGKVRFELSNASAEQRHLKFSSRLITVAQNMKAGAN